MTAIKDASTAFIIVARSVPGALVLNPTLAPQGSIYRDLQPSARDPHAASGKTGTCVLHLCV